MQTYARQEAWTGCTTPQAVQPKLTGEPIDEPYGRPEPAAAEPNAANPLQGSTAPASRAQACSILQWHLPSTRFSCQAEWTSNRRDSSCRAVAAGSVVWSTVRIPSSSAGGKFVAISST